MNSSKRVKRVAAFSLIILALFFFGCSARPTIQEIKSEAYIGETVRVEGIVIEHIQVEELSGYMLRDDSKSSILIVSDRIPEEGEEVSVTGLVHKNGLVGYYIMES